MKDGQKKIQKLFDDSEINFRELFDSATDLIHFCTPEGELIYVNKAWIARLGYTSEELLGTYIFDYIFSADVERYKEYRSQVLTGNSPSADVLARFMTKAGELIIAEGCISCKFEGNSPKYTRGILRDVTEVSKKEEELRHVAEQLTQERDNIQQLIHFAPDSVIVIDEENIVQVWNPMAEKVFGWTAQEATNKPLSDLIIPAEFREAHNAGLKRFLSTGKTNILNKTIEVPAIKKDGSGITISLTISQTHKANKSLFIAFIRNITEEKLNQKQLQEKQQQLEEMNRELEQYIWLTSHDLKEPIRKIKMFCGMLLNSPSAIDEKARYRLEAIDKAASRMKALTEDIFTYSATSQTTDTFELVDTNKIMEQVLSDFDMLIQETDATVNYSALPVIEAIPGEMQHLFQNIISNALKYRKEGTAPVITISTKADSKEVSFIIEDNGIGFDNKYAERIFKMFNRLHGKGTFEGTGLGLALCKKIVQKHNGRISADAQPGVGATFTIVLPLQQQPGLSSYSTPLK